MVSGLSVLGSFDDALLRVQNQAAALDATLADLTNRLLQVRNAQSETFRTLARLRLGAGEGDPLVQRLRTVDDNVKAALDRRGAATQEIDRELALLAAESERLRQDRARAAARAEAAAKALAETEAAVQKAVAETEAYREAAAAAREADGIADAAEAKAKQAEEDHLAKGKPYENDPLFHYLWQRGFGTAAYRAGPITRLGDRWVARLVGFEQARASYALLQEIPRRLAEHAQRRRAAAEEKARAVTALLDEAMTKGDAALRVAALKEAEAAVDAIDERIDANARKAAEAAERRATLLGGGDPVLGAATAAIEAALRDEDLSVLRSDARRTPSPEDDAAVAELERLDGEERALRAEIARLQEQQAVYRKQMTDLTSVRRDYRHRGYNRGSFDGVAEAFVGSLLAEMLKGGIGRDAALDRIGRHHRPTPGGGWGGGWSAGGSRGSSRGGGDFRTGGGF